MEHEASGGIAALGIDLKTMLIQAVNFLILLFLLMKFAYKPIVKMLNERSAKITESMALAEKTKKQAEELEKTNQEKIAKVKTEAKQIIDDMRTEVKNEAQNIKDKAQKDAVNIVERAQAQTEIDREKMLKSLKKELADLVLLATEKLTKKTIEIDVQRKLADDVINELEKSDI